jgi:hypothetical protein
VLFVPISLCFEIKVGKTVEDFLGFNDCSVRIVLWSSGMGGLCIFHVICFNFLIFSKLNINCLLLYLIFYPL